MLSVANGRERRMESGQYLWAAGQYFYSEDDSSRSFCRPVECQGGFEVSKRVESQFQPYFLSFVVNQNLSKLKEYETATETYSASKQETKNSRTYCKARTALL